MPGLQYASLAAAALPRYGHVMDDAARRIAAIVDEALHGEWGPIPLQRVVARHLDLFHELRDLGVPWPGVARRFAAAGIDKPPTWWRAAYSTAASRERQRQARSERAIPASQPKPPPSVYAAPAQAPDPVPPAGSRDPYAPRTGRGLESLAGTKLPRKGGETH